MHGLEGTSCDMRTIRSLLSYLCPNSVFILSEENEEDTKVDINKMGEKLAQEVRNFVEYYTD